MPLKYKKRIIAHLTHSAYSPAAISVLGADLGVENEEMPDFENAVRTLVSQGTLALDDRERVVLPPIGAEITGSFRKNARGFGFVVPDSPVREGDVFIPPGEGADALTGDTVRVAVYKGKRRGEDDITGTVVEVLKRKRAAFSGELVKRGGQWLVFPDGKEMTQPIVVADPTVKNAREGHKVLVEIVEYPEGDVLAEGVITRVLGEAGRPDVETQAVVAAFGLPGDFPEPCVEQAREAAQAFDLEIEVGRKRGFPGRLDLRDTFIITIDPNDSKDFDDAISIKVTDNGGWELGVHIADVSHFVKPETPLDDEARARSNSVYLPRHVIPMLPEVLSNGICSLSEGVERYCKSAFMRYDREGSIQKEWVAATVIKSAKRLTYLEAQGLIDGRTEEARKHARTDTAYTPQLLEALRQMDRCARAIRERRRRGGMIHLELPDAELVFNEEGRVIDVVPEDDAFTHTLIEMFMVEANEVLARLFEGVNVPLLRRIHPEPTPGPVDELRATAKVAGYTIPKRPTRQELQMLLDSTAGTGAARAVHMAVLRTLTRAEYSPALIGHFALASNAYAHFTSPIRRYADLTVHRALEAYLERTDNGTKRPRDDKERHALGRDLRDDERCPDQDTLVQIGRHASAMESNAEDAERDLRQFLVLQFLQDHVGEDFVGIVTGTTNSGVFIQLDKYLAEGLIKTTDLPVGNAPAGRPPPGGSRWTIDQRSGKLVHTATGRSYGIGDRVNVRIANIELALRRMDLVIADPKSRDAGKKVKTDSLGGGLGGGGIKIDWETFKAGKSGATARSQRSKSRDKGKSDFRKDKKDKGKRQ